MTIFAVDPGPVQSAWCVLDDAGRPVAFGLEGNEALLERIEAYAYPELTCFVIEMIASYGMAVGKSVFETCVWIGKFEQAAGMFDRRERVYRMEEKMTLCHDSRAKDAHIRQALIDMYGDPGTKKTPGVLYGMKKDMWAALAVGVTFAKREGDAG